MGIDLVHVPATGPIARQHEALTNVTANREPQRTPTVPGMKRPHGTLSTGAASSFGERGPTGTLWASIQIGIRGKRYTRGRGRDGESSSTHRAPPSPRDRGRGWVRGRGAEAHGLGREQPAPAGLVGHRRADGRGRELAQLLRPAEAGGVDVELAAEAEVGADDLALGLDELDGLVGLHGGRRDEVRGDDGRGAGDAHCAVDLWAGGVSIVVLRED